MTPLIRIAKRWLKLLGTLVLAGCLCGCFDVSDSLELRPDGSGTVRLTLRASVSEETLQMVAEGGSPDHAYPPFNADSAARLFPAKDFVVSVQESEKEGARILSIQATFTNVNALLASPYGRAHQLSLTVEPGGALRLRALSGMEGLARMAQSSSEMAADLPPDIQDLQKKKNEARVHFAIALPHPVTTANGTKTNKAVQWTIERSACKDDPEFAQKLGTVFEAACDAKGLSFSPVTPVRLGLYPFQELVSSATAESAKMADTNRVLAAARFIPIALQITRSMDFSGEQSMSSVAELSGAVALPAELKPQRWGRVRIEQVIDSRGENLLLPARSDFSRQMMFSSRGFPSGLEGDDSQEHPKSDEGELHPVKLIFQAPLWKTKQIAKIKATVDAQYLGGSQVVKLTNAIPARLVIDPRKGGGARFDSRATSIRDPRLSELGLSLQLEMAMVESGATMLHLQAKGSADVVEVQVFDSAGHPWPTTRANRQDSNGSFQVVVTGRPAPPFSLALLVGGLGPPVPIPFHLEHIAIEPETQAAQGAANP